MKILNKRVDDAVAVEDAAFQELNEQDETIELNDFFDDSVLSSVIWSVLNELPDEFWQVSAFDETLSEASCILSSF